jgi:hypothetical protein
MLFARDPFGPFAIRFHARGSRPARFPERHRLPAPAATTRPADKSAIPILLLVIRALEQPASEEACWPNTIERGAPTRISAEPRSPVYPSILVASPNPEGQESPSYHRQDLGLASQHTPRRVCLGYRPDAFHYRPSGASDSFSEPTRVTPDSLVPPLLPAHVTTVPFVPTETAHLRRA